MNIANLFKGSKEKTKRLIKRNHGTLSNDEMDYMLNHMDSDTIDVNDLFEDLNPKHEEDSLVRLTDSEIDDLVSKMPDKTKI